MGLFGKKPTICTICKKETKHKHKAKKEWYVDSPLCADCYMDKMKDAYDSNIKSKCLTCGTQKKSYRPLGTTMAMGYARSIM